MIDLFSLTPKLIFLKESEGIKQQPPATEVLAKSFSQILENYMDTLNTQQLNAKKLAIDLFTGRLENIHELIIELQKAEFLLNLSVVIRDRLIRAYESIINLR